MNTIFDQEKWSATQAALHIFCDVRLGSEDVAMRQLKIALAAWLADSDRLNRAFPINNPVGLKRLTTFATKAEATWGAGFATLELHPAIWTWFVASKCWRSSPKGYWQDFHRWSADNVAQGRIVLVQRRVSPNKTWSTPTLTTIGEADMDFGVQPTVLVFRPLEKRKATSEWRTVIHALNTDTSVQPLRAKAQGHTSRSRGCEEAIKTLLPAVCRLTREVRRSQSDDVSHPPYEAPTLQQVDLFELMSKVAGWSTVDRYGVSTREKALSRVVKCCRGKRSGTTKASTKPVQTPTESASVRKTLTR